MERTDTWKPRAGVWIWLAGPAQPRNAYAAFRRTVHLERAPRAAWLRISADCRYVLFVNGERVGRGPVLTEPRFKQYDAHSLAGRLRAGENALAVLVLYRHHPSFRTMGARGGLLAELEADGRIVAATDRRWQARWADEYLTDVPPITFQYGLQEWKDARREPLGWTGAPFDASGWAPARKVRDAARHWPAALEPRVVPLLAEKLVLPARVITWNGFVARYPDGQPGEVDPALQIDWDYPAFAARARDVDALATGARPAVFDPAGDQGVFLVVDFGRILMGRPYFDIEIEAGATIDLAWGETLALNRVHAWVMQGNQRYAERYYTRAGRQQHEAFDVRGMRYLQLNVRHVHGPFRLHRLGAIEQSYPLAAVSEFGCSDPLLSRIWELCRRTVEVCLAENFVADIKREQNQWIDHNQTATAFFLYGSDLPVFRQFLTQFARSQRPTGLLESAWPRSAESAPIPIATPIWIILLYRCWLHSGDLAFVRPLLATVARALAGLEELLGTASGLLTADCPPPHWNWVDWEAIDHHGEAGILNAYYLLALEAAARLARASGAAAQSRVWATRASQVRRALAAALWDEDRAAFVDCRNAGRRSAVVSQQTNAMLALARCGPPARLRRALGTALAAGGADVPSTLQFRAYLYEACESLGMDGFVLDDVRQRWGRMLEQGATCTWETEKALELDQSLCHPWTSHPLVYFCRNLLGVTPLTGGFRRFSFCLLGSGPEAAAGRILTPHGPIGVTWRRAAGRLHAELEVPRGTAAVVAPPRQARGREEGSPAAWLEVDGRRAQLGPVEVAAGTYTRRRTAGVVLGPGRHRLTSGPLAG